MCWIYPRWNRYTCRSLLSRSTKESRFLCFQRCSTFGRRYWWDVFRYVNLSLISRTAGVLTTYASWRWAFYLQAIMTACFVVAVYLFVPNDARTVTRREPIDWFGALLVSAGLCSFCFALTDAETSPDGWATSYIIASLILGVVCIGLFILLQARLKYPLMPLTIWRYPQFPRVIATYFLGFTTFAGVLVFNYTLMWQIVFGRNAVGVWSCIQRVVTVGCNMEHPVVVNRTSD